MQYVQRAGERLWITFCAKQRIFSSIFGNNAHKNTAQKMMCSIVHIVHSVELSDNYMNCV